MECTLSMRTERPWERHEQVNYTNAPLGYHHQPVAGYDVRPANHLYDKASDLDYRQGGSRHLYSRENHSPLRHPSPPVPSNYYPASSDQYRYGDVLNRDSASEAKILSPYQHSQNRAPNADSITITDQMTSNPLRRRTSPSPTTEVALVDQHRPEATQFDNTSKIQQLNREDRETDYETAMVRQEIGQLNRRLDLIDQHCREFTRLAQEKNALDQNLKNLNYLDAVDHQNEAQQQVERASAEFSNPSKSTDSAKFETRVRPISDEVGEPQIIPSNEVRGSYRPEELSAIKSSKSNSNLHRDRSLEEKQMAAAFEYQQDMEKLQRIMDNRRESLERAAKDEAEKQPISFQDDDYLKLLGENSSPYRTEAGARPLEDRTNRFQPTFSTQYKSPAYRSQYTDATERRNVRVQFREEADINVPKYHQQPTEAYGQQQESQGQITSPPPQFNYNLTNYDLTNHARSHNAFDKQTSDQAHQTSPTRSQSDFERRSPSPIQDMDYFNGIKALREEQNAFYQQLLASQKQQSSYTSEIVKLTRNREAKAIQATYLSKEKGKKKQSLKSKQHDEFAVLNYYNKVSKYDLDRGNLCMKQYWRTKQQRRVENAKAKREMIKQASEVSYFAEVSAKVNRIRDLSIVKETQKLERRENAMRHQELLKEFLDKEKANRTDDRPTQYANNTSVFGPAPSVNEMRASSRSASRSPLPSRKNLSSAMSKAKTQPRTQEKKSVQSDLIPVRQLDFAEE